MRQFLVFVIVLSGCKKASVRMDNEAYSPGLFKEEITGIYEEQAGKGGLLLTRFTSLEDFKSNIEVQYAEDLMEVSGKTNLKPQVNLSYTSGGREMTSVLQEGISQADFVKARNSTLWSKIMVGIKCPYAFWHRKELLVIEHLGRRRPPLFGKGDVAFYDLAEAMVQNTTEDDLIDMSCEDLSEKGYLNTFNHITAQAFMTLIFSERLADFIADVHELYNMPELISGIFSEAQLGDFVNGPVDNYVDMINNEWGQELGKNLDEKYSITPGTYWTPELLTNVLNDIQNYNSWAFQVGYKPFRPEDKRVVQFAWKINYVLSMD